MPAEIGYVLVRLTDGCPASIGRGGLVGRNGALSKILQRWPSPCDLASNKKTTGRFRGRWSRASCAIIAL
jgi:hypothetical protein